MAQPRSRGEITARAAEQRRQFVDQYRKWRNEWATDPEAYVRQRLGMRPTWQQRQALKAIAEDGAKVSIRSGHGTGKSGVAAGIVLWFLETRDYPKIPCTAPTSHQLRDVLWAEIAKWMRAADTRAAARGLPKFLWLSSLLTFTNDRIYDNSAKTEWYATARTSSKDNPDALQGFHASNLTISEDGRTIEEHKGGGQLLFVIEEASGVPNQVFEVAEGALSSHDSRLLMLANPTRTTGYFADSHKKNRSGFTTLHFKSGESPLVDPSYRQKLVDKWGEDSNIVRVRADGEFPKQDDDVLIALEVAEAALDREPRAKKGERRRLGIDVARYGNDRTVYVVREGPDLIHIEIAPKQDTMRTVGRARQLRKEFRCDDICPDEIGLGAGVVDRLRELGEPVCAVNFARKAPSRHKKEHDAQGKTMRDFLWLEMADWFATEPSLIRAEKEHAEDLVGEATSVTYSVDSDGRIIIESKDSMKKPGRLGFSPDIADALACTFTPTTSESEIVTLTSRIF